MPDEPPILDYAKPTSTSVAGKGLRIVGVGVCIIFIFIGLCIAWFGLQTLLEIGDVPTRDRPSAFFFVAMTMLIGSTMTGFSIRWIRLLLRPPGAR